MKIIFCVDANAEIGSGHLFRCLNLAHSLKSNLETVVFAGEISEPFRSDFFLNFGFQLIEGRVGKELFSSLDVDYDCAVIDLKFSDSLLECEIRNYVERVVVIADRPGLLHDCDVLISPNLYLDGGNPFENTVPENCITLIGPTFLPLRREFMKYSPIRKFPEPPITVASFFGGADPGDQSQVVLDVARLSRFSKLKFKILGGPLNLNNSSLKDGASGLENVEFIDQLPNTYDFWKSADIGVGSLGTSAWERCAVALPSICTSQNAEQIEDAVILNKLGAIIYIGSSHEFTSAKLEMALAQVMKIKVFENMSRESLNVITHRISNLESTHRAILG